MRNLIDFIVEVCKQAELRSIEILPIGSTSKNRSATVELRTIGIVVFSRCVMSLWLSSFNELAGVAIHLNIAFKRFFRGFKSFGDWLASYRLGTSVEEPYSLIMRAEIREEFKGCAR